MSLVLGIVRDERWALLADSAAEHSDRPEVRLFKTAKLARIGPDFVVGATGSYRLVQILAQYCTEAPATTFSDWRQRLFEGFIPRFRLALEETRQESLMMETGSELLGIINGHLFEMDATLHAVEPVDSWAAIGSGAPYAMGAIEWCRQKAPDLVIPSRIEQFAEVARGCTYTVNSPWQVRKRD